MHHSTARLHAAIHESPLTRLLVADDEQPTATKLDVTRHEGGSALLPTVFTAIVLHFGAFGRRPAPKYVRTKTTIERVMTQPRRDLSHPAIYER